MLDFIISLISGGFAGLGFGGGWIMMVWLLGFRHLQTGPAKTVVLLLFIPAAVFSVVGHAKSGLIHIKQLWFPALLGIGAVVLGLWLSSFIGEDILRWCMVALTGGMGVYEVIAGIRKK